MTNYQLTGQGKLIFLLHGWGDSSKGLADLSQALAKNYRVLSVDLPGFGGTQNPKEVWGLDNYSEFIASCFTKLDLKQPYAVIGHSNGGAVAVRALGLKKLQPKRLVLLAASGIRTKQKSRRLILNIIAKTGNIATIWMPERYRKALRQSLYATAGSDMLVAPELEETFKKTVRQDVQNDAANLDLPTLIINGTEDKAVPVQDGQQYKRLIKDSKLEIIDGAGHFVHQDEAQKVEGLIQEFLK